MMRHNGRRLELIPFEADTTRSIPLPRDRLIKRINLEFSADVDVTNGGAAGAVLEDSTQRIIKQIEVVGDGVTTLFRIDGRGLYYKNKFESFCPPYVLQATAVTTAVYPIGVNLDIWFANNIGIKPPDTYLPAPVFNTLELRITWGNGTDLFDAAYTGTVQSISAAFGMRPVIYETTQPTPQFMRFQDFIDQEVSATTADFIMDLPTGQRGYQAVMLRTLDEDLNDDALINFINLISGEKFNHYQQFPWLQMQRQNEKDFHLEAIPSGYVYLYLLEDGRIPSALHTYDVNSCKFRLDVTAGAGTAYVRAYLDYVSKL